MEDKKKDKKEVPERPGANVSDAYTGPYPLDKAVKELIDELKDRLKKDKK